MLASDRRRFEEKRAHVLRAMLLHASLIASVGRDLGHVLAFLAHFHASCNREPGAWS